LKEPAFWADFTALANPALTWICAVVRVKDVTAGLSVKLAGQKALLFLAGMNPVSVMSYD
jgi:hypothetical protein